jgi:hypothetical protein
MTIVFQDSFDHYGDGSLGVTRMKEGPNSPGVGSWVASVSCDISESPTGAGRTGPYALELTRGNSGGVRGALPDTYPEVYVHLAYYAIDLPNTDSSDAIFVAKSAANARIGSVFVTSSGAIRVLNSAAAEIANTGAPVVAAGGWHQIAIRFKIGAGTGEVEVKVNNVGVLDVDTLSLGATEIGQWEVYGATNPITQGYWVDDYVISFDDSATPGTHNNGFLGSGVRVATLRPRLDDETGWTANRRYKNGTGVGRCVDGNDAFTCADNVQFELGASDYTMEGFFKFTSLPSAANLSQLFGKYRESTNERSYSLYYQDSELLFDVATDGTVGTLSTLVRGAFSPIPEHYYHVCIQRASSVTTLFVDGVPIAAPVADANTYHDNTSLFALGGRQNGATSILSNTSFFGFMDEVRVTKGVARYNTTGFAVPSVPLGRNVGDDTDFASVSLLLGFDAGIIDESSFARAVTARGDAVRYAVDDAPTSQYPTVNNDPPIDDTGIEAPFIAASSVLTFTGQPSNGNTVTVDDNVYTFNTVLGGAGSVLIGASVSASIDNLVAAINGDAGEGTTYGTGTVPSDEATAQNIDNDQMFVFANTPGAAGNAIDIAESGSTMSWALGATALSGGLDIPTPSSFFVTRLPAQTTGVRAVALYARARKTDVGDGKIQMSFVTADDSSANGTEHELTTNYAWIADIIEEDPSTTAALTPASFTGARIRVDRTE